MSSTSPARSTDLMPKASCVRRVAFVVVVSGYDVVAAQTVHARKTYDHPDVRFGHRYADILGTSKMAG